MPRFRMQRAITISSDDQENCFPKRLTAFKIGRALKVATAAVMLTPVSTIYSAEVPAVSIPASAEIAYSESLIKTLIEDSASKGDTGNGAAVFASSKFGCLACHKIGEHGGDVGPGLSDLGKRRDAKHIIESLIWPKREVEEKYRNHQIVTEEGRTVQGYLNSKTDDFIELIDPSTKVVTKVATTDIDFHREGSTLMPEGLYQAMSPQERHDLIKFLMLIGRENGVSPEEVAPLIAMGVAHSHGPAKFEYVKAPLKPENWPHWEHPVNRFRLYDFYTKQARHFRDLPNAPKLMAEFPGVEGEGGDSEIRRQSKAENARWNDVVINPVLAGIVKISEKQMIPKGVCVRLGEQGDVSCCFDPQTLTYRAIWKGKFLKFSAVRHGMMDGLTPDGELQPLPAQESPQGDFKYLGFFRSGNRVVFHYRINGKEYLDAPWSENGEFDRTVAPVEEHPNRDVLNGGKRFWTNEFNTKVTFGAGKPYAVDTIEFPTETPSNEMFFFGGIAFLPDGAALLCTMQGDVWRVDGFEYPSKQATWRKVASGIQQAQGIWADKDGVFVMGRDQITRLHDLNGDGEYDYHECFCNLYVTSTAGHDFICGLERDSQGNFYLSSGNQGLLQVSADGSQLNVIATGFRNPDGVGVFDDGVVAVPCSQGTWTPASMICAVRPPFAKAGETPPYFGFGGPKDGKPPELPFVYFPRGIDNSTAGQVIVHSDKWGPLNGQMIHLSFGACNHQLILRDEVDGQLQGAVVPMVGDFRSGIHRGRFRQQDGQLYVAGQTGWGAFTLDDGNFERVRYTGEKVQLPVGFHVHENGIKITFSEKVDPQVTTDLKQQFVQAWNYRYSGAYGSPEFSTFHQGTPGHDRLTIRSVTVLPDGKSVFVELPEMQPINQVHLVLKVDDGDEQQLFVTAHKLDKPFQEIPGYQASKKILRRHPIHDDLALQANRVPNPWRNAIKGARKVVLKTPGNLQFDHRTIKVKAGETIQLQLINPDVVPHNWVLLKTGTLEQVGQLANLQVADADAFAKHYIPKTDDVLNYVDIIDPGKNSSIYFKVPEKAGSYPFVCTFPGHWTVMNGELLVQ